MRVHVIVFVLVTRNILCLSVCPAKATEKAQRITQDHPSDPARTLLGHAGCERSPSAEAMAEVQRMTEAQMQHNWAAETYGGMAPSSAVSHCWHVLLLGVGWVHGRTCS